MDLYSYWRQALGLRYIGRVASYMIKYLTWELSELLAITFSSKPQGIRLVDVPQQVLSEYDDTSLDPSPTGVLLPGPGLQLPVLSNIHQEALCPHRHHEMLESKPLQV